jgi:hypothetical protein
MIFTFRNFDWRKSRKLKRRIVDVENKNDDLRGSSQLRCSLIFCGNGQLVSIPNFSIENSIRQDDAWRRGPHGEGSIDVAVDDLVDESAF